MRRTLTSIILMEIFAFVVAVALVGGSAVQASEKDAGDASRQAKTPEPKLMVSPRKLNLGKKISEAATGRFTISAENGTFSLTVNPPRGKGADAYHIASGGGAFTLQPGAVATVTVLFDPLSKGNFAAKISVSYSYQITGRKAEKTESKTVNVVLQGSAAGLIPTPTVTPTPTPTETPTPTPTPTAAPFQGHVDGGSASASDPIVGATATLYAIGSSGYGTGQTVLGTVTTDSSGNFSFTEGSFACPANDPQTYLAAAGGIASSVGSGTSSAIGMIALSGRCNSLGASTFVTINPLTTIAVEWALAQFTDSTGLDIGTSSTNSTGLNNSINLATTNVVQSVAQSVSGVPVSFLETISSTCSNDLPAANCDGLTKLDTLANVLSACVESPGPSSSPCNTLFENSAASTTTLQASHVIATNPESNAGSLFGIQSDSPPFVPAESAAPNSWVLAVSYTGGGLNYPQSVAIDTSGNVWITNCSTTSSGCSTGTGSVSEFDPLGVPVAGSPFTGNGLDSPGGIAIDLTGKIWAANGENDSLSVFDSSGSPVAGSPFSGGGLDQPTQVAIDGSGNAWIANDDESGDVSEFAPSGRAISGSSGYTGGGLGGPVGVAIDASGDVWVSNFGLGTDSLSEFRGGDTPVASCSYPPTASQTGCPISPPTGYMGGNLEKPIGLAIDQMGNVWVADSLGTVSEFSSSGMPLSGSTLGGGSGLSTPYAIAIDGAGNVWVANTSDFSGHDISELCGANTANCPAGFVTGQGISPETGYTGGGLDGPIAIAIDASGNVWVANSPGPDLSQPHGFLTEFIGAARPVLTPLAACLKHMPASTVCVP